MKPAPTMHSEILVCPETKQHVMPCSCAEAEAHIADGQPLAAREAAHAPPFGATEMVLLRADHACAYPVDDGLPILMAPEMLFSPQAPRTFDLHDPKYEEAYDEMAFYNAVSLENAQKLEATGETDSEGLKNVFRIYEQAPDSFPEPRSLWLDATYDCAAQWDAYTHFGTVAGKRVMQLGGSGIHAVKFLLAGASEAWLLTPMLGEAKYAQVVARKVDVAHRLHCVVGVAEELPFVDACFDVIFSAGCVHHTRTEVALPEVERVLRPGGTFAAMDPWRAPLYGIGTKLLGKREPEVYCRPLTQERVAPLFKTFEQADVVHHGALTRYPLLALQKFGLRSKLDVVWRIYRVDDALCSLVPPARRMGSSVALLATKSA